MANDSVLLSPYAEWLEGFIRKIVELQPVRIGVCALMEDGSNMTGYYGEICHEDKALMAYHIHCDATLDMIAQATDEEEDCDD